MVSYILFSIFFFLWSVFTHFYHIFDPHHPVQVNEENFQVQNFVFLTSELKSTLNFSLENILYFGQLIFFSHQMSAKPRSDLEPYHMNLIHLWVKRIWMTQKANIKSLTHWHTHTHTPTHTPPPTHTHTHMKHAAIRSFLTDDQKMTSPPLKNFPLTPLLGGFRTSIMIFRNNQSIEFWTCSSQLEKVIQGWGPLPSPLVNIGKREIQDRKMDYGKQLWYESYVLG